MSYDGQSHTATVTSITGVNGETGATVGTVALNTTHTTAGTYASDTWSFTGGTNYNNIASTTISNTITKAHLSVTADAESKTYDGQVFTGFTGTVSGFVNGETASVVSGTAAFSGPATTAVNAGTYSISVAQGSLAATNYDFTAFNAGTLTINKATATVVVTPYNVSYDGQSHTATVTSITGVNGETGATVGTVTLNTTHTTAGNYASDTWSFTGTANYNNIASTTITNTITKAHLTVSANAQSKTYDGQAFTGFTATVSGFVNSETASVVSGTAAFSGAATTAVNAGTYSISVAQGTLTATNYDFTAFNAGTLTIAQRKLTVSATVVNRPYDGTTIATVNLTDNRVAGDLLSTSFTSAAFPDPNAGYKTVTVTGIAISGNSAGNYYLFSTSASAPGNISLRPLTGTVTIGDRVYNGGTSANVTSRTLSNLVGQDVVTYAGGTASFIDKNVATGKPVTVTGLYLTGAASGNYTVNSTASAAASITPYALTITATGVNKLYDGTTTASVTLADNRITSDVLTDGYASASFTDSAAGLDKPVSVAGITLSGADAGNYTFNTTASTTASITVGSTVPVVTTQPVSQNVLPGASVTFTAAASSTPAPTVQWQVSSNSGVNWSNISGATSTSYSPTTTLADNGKQFRAVFTNAAGSVTTKVATLNVTAAQISAVGVQWGASGTVTLVDASGGRLLPAGRITDLPWLNIDRLTITLNRAISSLSAADITVSGVTVANYGPVTISGSGQSWIITLSKAITDPDKVTVKLANAELASYQRRLDILPGDVNDDGVVNGQDIVIVRNQVLNIIPSTIPLTFLDIDGSGLVDNTDLTLVSARNGKKLPK